MRVRIAQQKNGDVVLTCDKWKQFAAEKFDMDVKWIHFVEQGDECFYVTGYYENGNEFGVYDGIMGRFMKNAKYMLFVFVCLLVTL